jgi:hypothetical protein
LSISDWFRRSFRKRQEPRIEFLHEQDGAFELEVKASLLPLLQQHDGIQRAYLAKIGFQPRDRASVALCLAGPDRGSEALVRAVANVFKGIAPPDLFLDVLFLAPEQEDDLRRVCSPFLDRAT